MPFSFIKGEINRTENYNKWMQPLNQSEARLVTSLGHNSDLIELSLETQNMVFFKKNHAMRFIKSIFPLAVQSSEDENNIDEVAV